MHIDFTQKLMEALKEEGINIGIDTCGYVSWIDIEKILPYTDFFLWDIKHMNPETHKKLTGVSNEPILKNLRAVSEKNIPIYIRLPMITGYNDSEVNIRNVCKFAQGLSSLAEINLLPLHHLGSARYQSLNLAYPMADLPLQSNAFMQDMKRIVESYGLKCSIIG
jgi:pyruvate formate lyase activating enzyme